MKFIGRSLSEHELSLLEKLNDKKFLYSASTRGDHMQALERRKLIARMSSDFRKAHFNLSNMYKLTSKGKRVLIQSMENAKNESNRR